MVEIGLLIALCIAVGILGGFFNSLMKWLETNDPFESKKNVKAILVGAFTGLALGIAAISTLTLSMSLQNVAVTIGMIFLSAVGVDQATSRVSGMVSKNTTPAA